MPQDHTQTILLASTVLAGQRGVTIAVRLGRAGRSVGGEWITGDVSACEEDDILSF